MATPPKLVWREALVWTDGGHRRTRTVRATLKRGGPKGDGLVVYVAESGGGWLRLGRYDLKGSKAHFGGTSRSLDVCGTRDGFYRELCRWVEKVAQGVETHG